MDRRLELRWCDVAAKLIIDIASQLQLQLPEPLLARVKEDIRDQFSVLWEALSITGGRSRKADSLL
jgi:hypothetical protein